MSDELEKHYGNSFDFYHANIFKCVMVCVAIYSSKFIRILFRMDYCHFNKIIYQRKNELDLSLVNCYNIFLEIEKGEKIEQSYINNRIQF